MTTTVTDLMTRARERYNADNDDFFSDQMLRACIYDAQSELATKGFLIERTFTTLSIEDQREYSFPTTTLGIREVRYKNEKLIKDKLENDPKTENSDPKGTPGAYAIWNDSIILFPTPDTDNDTIQIRVYKYPDAILTNADVMEVPEEYKESIISNLLMWMSYKDQNLQIYDRSKFLWDSAVEKAVQYKRKRTSADRNTRVSDHYFSDFTNGV